VTVYTNFPEYDFKKYVAITVVEPPDSVGIQYKAWKFDSLPPRTEWKAAYDAVTSRTTFETAQAALQTKSFFAERLEAADSARFAKVAALHQLVVSHRKPADFELARRTLDSDSVMANRSIAAIILGNFADRDAAWWALVDAQREQTTVSSMAGMSLRMMGRRSPRTVNWAPMVDRLRLIVDGTNLFAFNQTMNTLTATGISPALAQPLLANGGTIVLAKLRSGDVFAKREAANFLARLSGLPSTSDADTFARWIDGLNAGRASGRVGRERNEQ
jgi:hypothetical protein